MNKYSVLYLTWTTFQQSTDVHLVAALDHANLLSGLIFAKRRPFSHFTPTSLSLWVMLMLLGLAAFHGSLWLVFHIFHSCIMFWNWGDDSKLFHATPFISSGCCALSSSRTCLQIEPNRVRGGLDFSGGGADEATLSNWTVVGDATK